MILLIDHYDSFTYNIYQAVAELGKEVEVVRYGVLSAEEILAKRPEGIILSPGPGHPATLVESIELVQAVAGNVPILGVCLGHQMIGSAFGGKVINAPFIRHGKVSEIEHQQRGIFKGLAEPLPVMRYHSLVLEQETLPDCLEIHSVAVDDGTIMAIKHKEYPIYGVQFHPESIGTPTGNQILEGFLTEIESAVIIK